MTRRLQRDRRDLGDSDEEKAVLISDLYLDNNDGETLSQTSKEQPLSSSKDDDDDDDRIATVTESDGDEESSDEFWVYALGLGLGLGLIWG
ncbi:hypothetical protein TIFTF001_033812 [Ficus carica]|uniref:Uncharacterized protein n=1 Tax=Ficus carica TaxID=3494 RepID=A0AA88DYV3_FICCA|nr:hypothetical protein TIFTF001_033812 [Ficus carica]